MESGFAQAELFPVIAEKVPKQNLLWQYLRATTEHGTLVPLYLVQEALDVSRQRVHQLINAGQLDTVEVCDRTYVPAVVLEMFMSADRKSGVHLNRRWVFTGDGEAVTKKRS
jgi:hypothetical protein